MKQFEISGPIGKELSREEMTAAAAKALGVAPARVAHCRVVRRSVDARNDIVYRYRIEAFAAGETYEEYRLEEYRDVSAAEPVIIVGAGPAGMFAALKLLTLGLKPVILERGRDVHARKKDMAALSVSGHVDPIVSVKEGRVHFPTASCLPALPRGGTSAKCFISLCFSGRIRRF